MPPTSFGRYLLLERLAVGGTAEIFKAKLIGVEGFEKTVAIKRILPHWSSNPNFIAMLIDEAKIMVRLNHERIVQVYELGKESDTYYMAMEWVQGTDLRRLTEAALSRKEPLTADEAAYIIAEVLRGLEFIHRQRDDQGRSLSIVHRDISPQNILLSDGGAVKIADFGIAHAASRSYETATGVLKGKFTYMSPEQARGSTVDARTDLFAAGIIFYELLSGRRLFAGGSDLEVLEKVRRFETADALDNLVVDHRLKAILAKALEPSVKHRYPSAHEFWKDLHRAQAGLGLNGDGERLAERIRRCFGGSAPAEDLRPLETLELGHPPSFSGISLVSRPGPADETTRSLEHPTMERGRKRRLFPWVAWGAGLLLAALIYFYEGNGRRQAEREALEPKSPESQATEVLSPGAAVPAPDSPPSPAIPETAAAESPPSEKAKLKKPETPAPGAAPTAGKGTLLVRALPWGKISVSGVVSGSERPVSRTLAYGSYQISVAFQDTNGQWKTVSRSVKIAKAATVCNASFRPDGKGSISCR